MSSSGGMDRRGFLQGLLRSAAAAAAGGAVWGGFVATTKHAPLALRPPGALAGDAFLSTCIRCGTCVEACPYGTLSLATPGEAAAAGTPVFTPRDVPCHLCQDVPCTVACPTGALARSAVSDETGALDVDRARMGLAVLDRDHCLAAWGLRCDACYRACPLIDKAIVIEHSRNERTGRHAVLMPVVQDDHCTGCGLCERACVTEKASIRVLPRDVVQGRVGDDYVRGWDAEDEGRIDPATPVGSEQGNALDWLNDGEVDHD